MKQNVKRNTAFKKWVHTSTALVFLFQQISPAFAMEPPEERDFSVVRTLPASSSQLPSSLPLPVELSSTQQPLPLRLEEVRQSLQQTVLESVEAIPDRFSSLIEDIRKTFAEAPIDLRNKVGGKLPNLVKESYSLYPWAFLRDEDDLGKIPVLTSDHAGFHRIKEVMGVLDDLCGESLLPAAFFSNLQQLQSEYKGYIEALCALPLDKRGTLLSPICLWGDLFEGKSYLVSKSLAYKLLSMDSQGIPVKHNATGSSIVTHVGRIYAKQNLIKERGEDKPPEGTLNPGMEWAMGGFHNLLIGSQIASGLVPSAFLVLSQIPVEGSLSSEKEDEKKQLRDQARDFSTAAIDKKAIINRLYEDDALKSTQNYSLQITSEVEGEFLETFLQRALKNPKMFDELDKPQVQSLVLSTLLMSPGDAKGDNLMVTKPNAQGKRHIISIDNDLSLASMMIKEGENFHTLEVRNILLAIPHLMEQELDRDVREHWESLNFPAFLLTWLKSLESHNTDYTELQRFIDPKTFSLLQFPLKLKKGTGESLLKRFQDLQQYLCLNPQAPVTLQSLYEQLDPLPALYTTTLLEQEQGPLKAFDVLYRQVRSIEEALELDKKPDREVKGQRVQERLDQEHTPKDAYKERTHPIEEIAEEVLKTVDFGALSPQNKVGLLEEAALLFPRVLQRVIVESARLKESLGSLFEGHPSLNLIALFIDTIPELLTQLDAQGNSLLHRAVKALAPENVISYLIEKGISLESENDAYETPLDLAMVYQNGPAFFALVNAGAGKRLQKAQTAETFYNRVIYTPKAAHYHQVFETLRIRSALINGMFIRHHFFQNSTQSPIELAEYGPQDLTQEAWDQLFDSNGVLKPIDPDATRKVGLVDLKGGGRGQSLGLFFKQYPALPGIETAVDILTLLLFYRGVPYTALANIKGVPYLISEGVGREENVPPELSSPQHSKSSWFSTSQPTTPHPFFKYYKRNNLSYVLKHTPERLKDVDEESLSEAILIAMLTGQEDGKPNNFMLHPIPEKPDKYRIVPIDNDQAFVPEASYPSSTSRQKGKPSRVQVKSVLFCLDQMNRPIHPSVVEVLVNLNPGKLLNRWLEKLSRLTQEHQALFTNPQLNDFWKKNETYIGIPFQRGDIQEVYFKLMKMQDLLKLKPTLTHLELLKEVLPFVHHRYNKIFKNPTFLAQSIHERFLEIDGEAYALKKGSDQHMTLSSSSNILDAKKITVRKTRDETIVDSEELSPVQWQEELTQAKQAYEDEAKQLLIRKGGAEIAAIMSGQQFKKLKLDLSRRSAYEQDLIFAALDIRGDPEKLSLTHSSELKDNFFKRSFPALRELDIRGCPQLINGVFALLMKNCPNLRSLNLAKNTALTKTAIINLIARDEPLVFKELEVLNVSECSTLQQVRLHAPKLQHFLASECPSLSELQLTGATYLKTLDLRNAHSLPLSTFNALIQGNQATLTQVQTEGAKNLPTIPRIPFQDIRFPFENENLRQFNVLYYHAINDNDPEAQYQLAEMYAKGQGVKQNTAKALEWCQQVFPKIPPQDIKFPIEKENLKKFEEYLKKAIENNDSEAQFQLSQMYAKGQGVKQNTAKALEWCQQVFPKIPPQDIKFPIERENLKKFEKYFKRATKNNDPEAQYQLAKMYEEGQVVKQNPEKALEWYGRAFEGFKNAAEKGHLDAQYQLAKMYAKGQVVKQHFETALEWYRKSAEKGHYKSRSLIAAYTRFLKGKLIYKPDRRSNKGRIELPIAELTNPLEGEFDLSKCDGADKYLSINTGYRKIKRSENKNKVEIWFSPHFFIKKNLSGSASHFDEIIRSWDASKAPVGMFCTKGDWDDMHKYYFLTTQNFATMSDGDNLYEKYYLSTQLTGRYGKMSDPEIYRSPLFEARYITKGINREPCKPYFRSPPGPPTSYGLNFYFLFE